MDVKLKAFIEATSSFAYLARLDMGQLQEKLQDDQLLDGVQNGCIQKFERTTELCWKAIKSHLLKAEGIEEASPKKVIKAYYLAGGVLEADYLLLLDAIEDRNRVSHIYDSATFQQIFQHMAQYAALFERTGEQLLAAANPTVTREQTAP
jgi:nucleotidyltransferase substrate binding protein (TIGR01987 family)